MPQETLNRQLPRDARAQEKLVEYNRADTINLDRIAQIVYGRLCGTGAD